MWAALVWRRSARSRAAAVLTVLIVVVAAACGSTSNVVKVGAEEQAFVFPGDPTAAERAADLAIMQRRAQALGGTAKMEHGVIVVHVPGGRSEALRLGIVGHIGLRPVTKQSAAGLASTPSTTPADELRANASATMSQYAKSGGEGAEVYEMGGEGASGPAIQSAKALEASDGSWGVQLVLRTGTPGIDQFNSLAGVCYEGGELCPTHKIAMAIDKQVIATPTISAPSFGRNAISLSAGFTRDAAEALAAVLNSGELPTPIVPSSG